MPDPLASTSESESAYADAVTESENNNIATNIARACFKAKHLQEWNQWTSTIDPLLCDDCDEKIGVLFP